MFFRKAKWLLLLLPLIVNHVSAQNTCNFIIKGQVTDQNKSPLPGVTVFLLHQKKGIATDSLGKFVIHNVCSGIDSLLIKSIGYGSKSVSIQITGDQSLTISLSEKVQELREIEIEEKLPQTEHAHNYVSLNEAQLSENAGKTLGESLKEITGVSTIQSGPGIFKPVIHGVHSQRVLILNYGIRQEGQQWGAEHAPEIDPFIASDVIVVKDASSIKYGTDALGGVIIVNPPALPEVNKLGGTLHTVFQSNGRSATLSGMLEGGIKKLEGWGWRIQGTAKRSGDFHSPDYSLTNTGIKELNFSGAIGFHDEKKGLEIFFSRFDSEVGILKGVATSDGINQEPPLYTTSFSYNINAPRQEVTHNLLKLNGHLKTPHGILRLQYGFQNNMRKEFDIRVGNLTHIPIIDLRLNSHTLESEWETGVTGKRTLCIGFTTLFQDNNNFPGTKRIPFVPNFTSTSGGVFSIAKVFVNNWVLDAGVRYDYRGYSVKGYDPTNTLYTATYNFHNASATLGSTVQMTKSSSFSTNVSLAWRPPHVVELFSFGKHLSAGAIEYGLLASGNEIKDIDEANVKNEQALKWVNTYRKNTDEFEFEVTGYANYIFNYFYLKSTGVTQTFGGVLPTLQYAQTTALFLGADISTEWTIRKNLQWINKATLLKATDEKNGDYFLYVPSSRFETAFRYESPSSGKIKKFFVQPVLKYVTRQTFAPRTITMQEFRSAIENGEDPLKGSQANFDFMNAPDGYLLVNVSTGFTLASKTARYNFRVSAENLLNNDYREYTNRLKYYADDMGSNYTIAVKCIF